MPSILSKGSIPHSRLPIRPASFYADWQIEPILGARVTGMDVDAGRVDVSGRSVPYVRGAPALNVSFLAEATTSPRTESSSISGSSVCLRASLSIRA